MMSFDSNKGIPKDPLSSVSEDMESIVIDQKLTDFNAKSYASYRSAMCTLSGMTVVPAEFDPLLCHLSNPSSPENPQIESTPDGLIFSAFEGDNDNGIQSSKLNLDVSSSEHLVITVLYPQKEQKLSNSIVPGGNSHVSYLVTTRTNLPEFGGLEFSVRRRFKDVVTLSERLSESYRGFFVPPRPDKSVVESQVMYQQEFVEQRRVLLEKYLKRLAVHPVIKRSNELRVFLQVQGKLPLPTSNDLGSRLLDGAVKLPKQLFGDSTSVISPHEAVQPARGGRDLLRMLKELKQSISNDWTGSKTQIVEEDKLFLDKKERLHELEQHLNNATRQAESLVKGQQYIGETMGELGLAILKLTKFENQEAVLNSQKIRASNMKDVATATIKASRLHRDLNAQTFKHLDTLHEYLGLMLAVHGAFSERSSALLTVQTLLTELSSLHTRAEKLETASSKIFGGDATRTRKIEELKETIRVTEDAKQCAIREYDKIKENNKSELERLERERHADFLNMLKGFAMNQVEYAEQIANVWAKVADDTRRYAKETT